MSRGIVLLGLGFALWFCCGFHSFGRVKTSLPWVALTFDDGPSNNTPFILKILSISKIPATFFVTGEHALQFSDMIKLIIAEGDEVENHSWSHPHLVLHAPHFISNELSETNQVLTKLTGHAPHFFRPPYGQSDFEIARIAHQLGLVVTLWSDTGFDWRSPGSQTIVANVIRNVSPGGIILLHDGADRHQTIEALPSIVSILQEKGYRFVSLATLSGLDYEQSKKI